jgi:hypothetical protein
MDHSAWEKREKLQFFSKDIDFEKTPNNVELNFFSMFWVSHLFHV